MSKRASLIALWSLLSGLVISGCGTTVRQTSRELPAPKRVTILAVNDMHAAMDRFPRLAFMADSLRQIYPALLLISAGDNQTGNPANDMHTPVGEPMINLMNHLGFAVSAVGNHEFDSGLLGFEYLSQKAGFPFISANVLKPEGSPLKLQPYVKITTRDGVRVGFISLLEVSEVTGTPASHPDKMKGFTFLPPLLQVNRYVSVADSVDIPIFLTHLGFETDEDLADVLDSQRFPLIIGGHSHTYLPEGTMENGVYITQAKSNLKYATLISVQKNPGGSYVVHSRNLPIDPAGSVDPEIAKEVEAYLHDPALMRVVGALDAPLKNKVEIGYLLTDALRDYSGADFALANGGGIRVPSLPAGDVAVRDIYAVDPFGNEGVVYELTGHQILELLYKHWIGDGYKICIPSGFKVQYLAESLEEDEDDVEIRLFDLDGQPLDLDRTYSVAMNNYLSTTFLSPDLPYRSLYAPTAEITMQYISKLKRVPSFEGRKLVEVVPVD